MIYALCVLGGLVLGAAFAWLWAKGRSSAAFSTINGLQQQLAKAEADLDAVRAALQSERDTKVQAETKLAEARQYIEDQKKFLDEARKALSDHFNALAAAALKSNNEQFLGLARKSLETLMVESKGDLGKRQEAINGLVKPLGESLKTYGEQIKAIEEKRAKAYGSLEEQVKALAASQQQLQKETGNLVNALRRPEVRGRWGEVSLKRVVELAGMSEHCDFTEQVSVESDEGRQRPDMILHLPAGREIVVDAKVSLDAYLDATAAATDKERAAHLNRHARQTRDHMQALAAKSYWQQFEQAPEFVVMFIPGESFFSAALDCDRSLIEDGIRKRVVLATPTTLIALVRAVAYGWRQEEIGRNAQEISDLGQQLYERLSTLADHFAGLGKALQRANDAYNRAVGSMESRVLISARRFKDMGATTSEDIPPLEPVETSPRVLDLPPAAEEDEPAPDAQ